MRPLPRSALLGTLIAIGVSGPALASGYVGVIVLDEGHPDRTNLESMVCPGSSCPERVVYLTCSSTCVESTQPQAISVTGHALRVTGIVTHRARALATHGDTDYRLYSAAGSQDGLVSWLNESVGSMTRAEQLGIRVINESRGANPAPCTSPATSPAYASLAASGVHYVKSSGNDHANGFSGGHCVMKYEKPMQPFFGQTSCDVNIISVGGATTHFDIVRDRDGLNAGCPEIPGGGLSFYPVFDKSNLTPNTNFVADPCLYRILNDVEDQAIHSGNCSRLIGDEVGTSYSAPYVSAALLAMHRRDPGLSRASARAALDQYAQTGSYTINTMTSPHLGQSVPFRHVTRAASDAAMGMACGPGQAFPDGVWYDPARSGWGIDIHSHGGSTRSATWFTYTAGNEAVWYQFIGQVNACGNAFSGPIGKRVRHPGGHTSISQVGYATLSFTSAQSARFRWELTTDGQVRRGDEPIYHLVWDSQPTITDHTGLWHSPSETGSGYSIVSQGSGHSIIALIYRNDPNQQGNFEPTWVAGSAGGTGNVLSAQLEYIHATNLCPGCTGPITRYASPVGPFLFEHGATSRVSTDLLYTGSPSIDWYRPDLDVTRQF